MVMVLAPSTIEKHQKPNISLPPIASFPLLLTDLTVLPSGAVTLRARVLPTTSLLASAGTKCWKSWPAQVIATTLEVFRKNKGADLDIRVLVRALDVDADFVDAFLDFEIEESVIGRLFERDCAEGDTDNFIGTSRSHFDGKILSNDNFRTIGVCAEHCCNHGIFSPRWRYRHR